MATPKQNYARQFQAYAQGIEPDIPASVRTYSIFNPDTGTWQRMTNNFRSPIPAQGQPVVPVQAPAQPAVDPVMAALAMAQQTQGRDWSRPLSQTPAQTSSRGPRIPSPASGGGRAVPVQGQPSRASQRAVEAPVAVQAGNPAATVSVIPEIPKDVSVRAPAELYQGVGIAPDGTVVNYNFTDEPSVSQPASAINMQEVGQMFQPQGQSSPQFSQWGEVLSPEAYEWRRKRDLLGQGFKNASLIGSELAQMYYTGGLGAAGGSLIGRVLGNRAFRTGMERLAAARAAERAEVAGHYAVSQANRAEMMNILRAQGRAGMTSEEAALAEANRFSPFQQEWVSPRATNVGKLSRGTANYSNESAPRALDAMRKVRTYESPHAATSQTIPESAEVAAKPASTASNPARIAKTMGSRETNIGGRLSGRTQKAEPEVNEIWSKARNPERTGTWGGARQAARDYSQRMSENIASGPTQRVVINPNVRVQDITKKPGGMTIWDRLADSKNYSEGFLNPYMRQTYGARIDVPFLPFAR